MALRQIAAASVIGAALAGCASHGPALSPLQPALAEAYRLDSGDKVRVTVFEQDGLTNTYAIDKTGGLSMPLAGTIPARGQTTKELEATIANRLREGFLRNPDITVEVEAYRPFFIMGEVTQGGQYSYVPGMTVQNAVAIAGGYTARANRKTVDLTRPIGGRIATIPASVTDPLRPGDTISVRERWF